MATPKVEGQRTGRGYWSRQGFLPAEASAFKNVTFEAIKDSRYIQVMIATRSRRRRAAIQNGMTVRHYYTSIRAMYVRRGFATTAKSLEFDGVQGRRLAFAFFNAYKDKYGLRDNTGKLIETPSKKVRVSRKPITGKRNIDQLIRKDQDEIKFLQFRLKFEKNADLKEQYRIRIQRHQDRITRLKTGQQLT